MISVCYTSARPDVVPPRVQEWLASAADPEAIEFVVTIDTRHAAHEAVFARLPRTRVFVNHGRPCCVDGWNLAARKARGRILIQCSDDLHPPARWDVIVRDRLADGARSAVLAISDGFTARPQFIPHAVVTRRAYREFGYLFHDAYWSMWSDNELSAVAYRRGMVVEAFDVHFAHSHGQVHDDVRVRHEAPHFGGQGWRTFAFREQHGFEPWIFDAFASEDGDCDGIYSPSWGARLPAYWAAPPRSADDVLALHRESHERRVRRWGRQPAVGGFQVLISSGGPARRPFLDLLTAELARQGIAYAVGDRGGDDAGVRLAASATARYVTFMGHDGWVSHNYGELVGDAIANDGDSPEVILHGTVGIDEAGAPRPTHFSFERPAADQPACRLRLPDGSMVWRRDVATSRRATSWSRIRGLLRFDETAPSLSSARSRAG